MPTMMVTTKNLCLFKYYIALGAHENIRTPHIKPIWFFSLEYNRQSCIIKLKFSFHQALRSSFIKLFFPYMSRAYKMQMLKKRLSEFHRLFTDSSSMLLFNVTIYFWVFHVPRLIFPFNSLFSLLNVFFFLFMH